MGTLALFERYKIFTFTQLSNLVIANVNFRYWIRHFPMCFDLNPQLSQAVHCLQGLIRQDSLEEDGVDNMSSLVDTSKV